ncbi:hypothetical protein OHA77_18305 [Streptosporangium sp. NBC_01639]|uniref:hypothetical protein n=1 Tax=Streptosporangium sp. NBC_01639 TaxID=2975948 RepID=UPI0038648E62|nr:hypothetical protein OHA77_18305 [Streptosporangium sp. NBC_01639]
MFARPTSALVAALMLVPAGVAAAGTTGHGKIVSADPVNTTPHVLDGIVNAIALVGGTVVVGGSFGEVRDAGSATTLKRDNIFAYDLATGRIVPGFEPSLDRPVNALAAGADGTVYAGGEFAAIGYARTRGLARLRLSDGAQVRGFDAQVHGGVVTSLVRRDSHLYVGGDFTAVGRVSRPALARLDAATGVADPGFAITPGTPRGNRVRIQAMALAGDRLAVDGNFTTLDGRSRPQLGLVDVGVLPAKVADWRTDAYAGKCMDVFPSYVRGLDFAPDGSYFAVVTTGGRARSGKMCDTAARFETRTRGEVRPTWVNHTGGDSLYSVTVTGAAVYVGGHQRWLDNPLGHDSAGPGAVERPGIGAIHPQTGKALKWNPTRERGIGVKAFLAHPGGLLVGSDTTQLGREYHARVGMFPMP